MVGFSARVPMMIWITLSPSLFFGPAGVDFKFRETIAVARVKLDEFGAGEAVDIGREMFCRLTCTETS